MSIYARGKLILTTPYTGPPKNSEFGIAYRSKAFIKKELAEGYYNLLKSTSPNSTEFKLGLKEMGLI